MEARRTSTSTGWAFSLEAGDFGHCARTPGFPGGFSITRLRDRPEWQGYSEKIGPAVCWGPLRCSLLGNPMVRPSLVALVVLFLVAACHDGGSSSAPDAPLVLAAGMVGIDPEADDPGFQVDLHRLDIGRVDSIYRLTTPADTPFSFDVLTRAPGNAGSVRVSLAHVADGGAAPGGAASLAAAGCVPAATGLVGRTPWLDAFGDGFARMTVGGAILRDQLLAFETASDAGGVSVALVEIAIGPVSSINRGTGSGGNHPGVVEEMTLYSSDSWRFGLPTVAVSGDRTSVVVYEGDRGDWRSPHRYELRLQHDSAAGKVTGGGSDETSPDSGNWRDHEIAALYNVLAVAHCGADQATVRISFDRGATFAQHVKTAAGSRSTRLVQVAMAADYSLAVLFWHTAGPGSASELMLLEGRPSAVDPGGSPTWFSFDLPHSVFKAAGDTTPLLTGAAWSAGGDLVVGHAFTRFARGPDRTWTTTTEFWCAVRRFRGEFVNQLLDRDVLVGRDPSVSLLGSGPDLRIFYAYEGLQGLRLRVSDDAGKTFSKPVSIGTPDAHTPTVFARAGTGGTTRVDVLYMGSGGVGGELHLSRWFDFATSSREDFRLTTSVMVPTATVPGGGGNKWTGPITTGYRLTQVAWMGYDAVLDGDEIVVVYDEETYDAAFLFLGAWNAPGRIGLLPPNFSSPGFSAAKPPPLAPGMTLPLPAPDKAHRHQLKLLRLD